MAFRQQYGTRRPTRKKPNATGERFKLEACNIITATPKALLVETKTNGEVRQHWLPVSQLRDICYGGDKDGPEDERYTGSLSMPLWLAKEKGYVQ